MNELIQVVDRRIGDGAIQTVNARDLHAFLEVGKMFAHWIKDRIEKYDSLRIKTLQLVCQFWQSNQAGAGMDSATDKLLKMSICYAKNYKIF